MPGLASGLKSLQIIWLSLSVLQSLHIYLLRFKLFCLIIYLYIYSFSDVKKTTKNFDLRNLNTKESFDYRVINLLELT